MDRCRAAGPDEGTVFATEPGLAARMIGRFLDAEHRGGRTAGDEVYGGNPKPRWVLEEHRVGYVFAVACSAGGTSARGSSARTPRLRRRPAGLAETASRYRNQGTPLL